MPPRHSIPPLDPLVITVTAVFSTQLHTTHTHTPLRAPTILARPVPPYRSTEAAPASGFQPCALGSSPFLATFPTARIADATTIPMRVALHRSSTHPVSTYSTSTDRVLYPAFTFAQGTLFGTLSPHPPTLIRSFSVLGCCLVRYSLRIMHLASCIVHCASNTSCVLKHRLEHLLTMRRIRARAFTS
ncbi:hypothetical protein F5Y03DRAFT_236553 [Xylaria venustula]|nr:hypothetical protein F5Y03DRAFT_236553 [Xylaria venustula]